MSTFAQLLALSKAETTISNFHVQDTIAQREVALQKKQQEADARYRKELEFQAKLRAKRLEDERRESDRRQKQEQETQKREEEMERRRERERQKFLGVKQSKRPSSPTVASSMSGSSRLAKSSRDSASPPPGAFLTREEKRALKMDPALRPQSMAGLKRSIGATMHRSSKPKVSNSGFKSLLNNPGRPTSSSVATSPSAPPVSARARILASEAPLIKLNVHKRDLRTTAEVIQDIEDRKNKVLLGDNAREFNDWFGKKKQPSISAAPTSSTEPSSRPNDQLRSLSASPDSSSLRHSKGHAPFKTNSALGTPIPKSTNTEVKAKTVPVKSTPPPKPLPSTTKHRPNGIGASASHRTASPVAARPLLLAAGKKRPRSPSLSPEPTRHSPAKKLRTGNIKGGKLSSEIWKLVAGKSKEQFQDDVFSDEEDDDCMEASGDAVMREEMQSAKLARLEDMKAEVEEKRREEEKRKRRREKERDRR